MSFSQKRFSETPVVGILRGYSKEDVLFVLEVYLKAGLSTVEITMNTKGACDIISAALNEFGRDLNIGAGTVTSTEQALEALQCGAGFIVTPNLNEEIIGICKNNNIPVFPGAMTPTEINRAWELGATMVKVFPCDVFGPSYIKAVLGPFSDVLLMPTGGVHPGNMAEYWDAGARAFGMGGCLFDIELIKRKDWGSLHKNLLSIKQKIEGII